MFNKTSMTGWGIIALIASEILRWAGVDVDADSVTFAANTVLEIIGWFFAVIGQLRRTDLTAGLLRK